MMSTETGRRCAGFPYLFVVLLGLLLMAGILYAPAAALDTLK